MYDDDGCCGFGLDISLMWMFMGEVNSSNKSPSNSTESGCKQTATVFIHIFNKNQFVIATVF